MYDVVVIGAGPVGSYAAWKLAEKGSRVLVLEQKGEVGQQVCCTGIISQECARFLTINDGLIHREVKSARLYSPSGKCLRLCRRETQAYILDRAAFDRTLAARAQSKGVEYALDSLATGIEVDNQKVGIETVRQGKKSNFVAKAAVISTGFGSGLIKGLGLGGIRDFVAGAQVEVEAKGIEETEVYFGQEIAPGFFGWLVPTSTDRALVGLLSRRDPGRYLKNLVSSLAARGKVVELVQAKPDFGIIPLKPLPRTYGKRVVVVGDAAGQVKPTTGGGIYYGLLCADIAVNVMHRALETDNLSGQSLAGYEREWKKKLARELKIGYWVRRLYERLSDGRIDRIFDIIGADGIHEAVLKAEHLSFDWHGEAMLRVVGHQAIAKAFQIVKLPLFDQRFTSI